MTDPIFFRRCAVASPNVLYLHGLSSVLLLLLLERGHAGRRQEHHVRLQIRVMQNLQRGRLQIQHADLKRKTIIVIIYYCKAIIFETYFSRVDDCPDCVERGPVQLLVELPVLDEPARGHVVLELRPGHEVVVLAVDLAIAAISGRI